MPCFAHTEGAGLLLDWIKKIEEWQLEAVWIVLSFVGFVVAIGMPKNSKEPVSGAKVWQTFISGLCCGLGFPVLLRDHFEIEALTILSLAAFVGGLLGMNVLAAIYGIDLQGIINKRVGGGK